MNAACERYLGSVRRECLDHVIILSARHLQAILTEYVSYFNRARPHQSLHQNSPSGFRQSTFAGSVVAFPVLGGLHHDYRRAA
jgi:putative transposase